jgi:hypothetical protein
MGLHLFTCQEEEQRWRQWGASPADGGGEVGVQGCGQAIMVVLRGRKIAAADVDRLRHAPCGHDAHELVEVRVVALHRLIQRLRQFLCQPSTLSAPHVEGISDIQPQSLLRQESDTVHPIMPIPFQLERDSLLVIIHPGSLIVPKGCLAQIF